MAWFLGEGCGYRYPRDPWGVGAVNYSPNNTSALNLSQLVSICREPTGSLSRSRAYRSAYLPLNIASPAPATVLPRKLPFSSPGDSPARRTAAAAFRGRIRRTSWRGLVVVLGFVKRHAATLREPFIDHLPAGLFFCCDVPPTAVQYAVRAPNRHGAPAAPRSLRPSSALTTTGRSPSPSPVTRSWCMRE